MKILILEPHGDDALLSCHDVLTNLNNEITLLTFSARSSYKLIEIYPTIKRAPYLDTRNLWFPDGHPLLKTHEVHRDYLDNKPIYDSYINLLLSVFRQEYIEDYEEVLKSIFQELQKDRYDVVLCPVGLSHPYHVIVSHCWTDEFSKLSRGDVPTVYYGDKHYIQTRYCKELFLNYVSSRQLSVTGYGEVIPKNQNLEDALRVAYPSEVKLLRFYSDVILFHKCIYAYDPNNQSLVERMLCHD